MLKKDKVFLLIMIVFIFFLNINLVSAASTEVVYFKTEACATCQKTSKHLKELEDKFNFRLTIYDIHEDEYAQDLMYKYSEKYNMDNLETGTVPVVFIGENYYLGENILNITGRQIKENEIPTLIVNESSTFEYEKQKDLLNTFAPITVFIAGFLDGFNPCALAMLLFFISFVFISEKNQKNILFIGLSFILGTFLAYFGIGLGILKFTSIFINAKKIMIVVYGITILFSFSVAILNIYDFIVIKKGKEEKIKNQLPQKIKSIIHNKIRGVKNSKFILLSSFLSGFIISFLEFFCTGQIYLPTITLILSLDSSNFLAIGLLFLYNLAFVTPLIIICVLIYTGRKITDASMLLIEHMAKIKILGAVFFITMGLLILKQLLDIL